MKNILTLVAVFVGIGFVAGNAKAQLPSEGPTVTPAVIELQRKAAATDKPVTPAMKMVDGVSLPVLASDMLAPFPSSDSKIGKEEKPVSVDQPLVLASSSVPTVPEKAKVVSPEVKAETKKPQ